MTVMRFIPLKYGTRFVIKESIFNLWDNVIEDIKIFLKKDLPSIIDVQFSSGSEESDNDSIDVIHNYDQLTEQAILTVLSKMIFSKEKKLILS